MNWFLFIDDDGTFKKLIIPPKRLEQFKAIAKRQGKKIAEVVNEYRSYNSPSTAAQNRA